MMYSAYKLNKQDDNPGMSGSFCLDVLLSLFGTSLLFHVQFYLLLPELHIVFSGGRSGGPVFPCLEEFFTVSCDPHSQRLWHSQ